jgi:hypothetical protein
MIPIWGAVTVAIAVLNLGFLLGRVFERRQWMGRSTSSTEPR